MLVTGGAGYVGSHAAKALAAAGFLPVTYDDLSTGNKWAVRWGPLEIGDVRDATRLREVMTRYRVEAVMHFAAASLVADSVRDPGAYWVNNVGGMLALLQSMVAADVRDVIFSSTCAVYGEPARVPIDETCATAPVSPYGATKLAAEHMLAGFAAAHGLRYAALRYFNAAGADPDGGIGESHPVETHLIPVVLDVALGRRPALTIFGDDYDTPDGTCIRDYVHVTDLAAAHVQALRHIEFADGALVLNLGTGIGLSVSEIIESARSVTGCPIRTTNSRRRPGDPPRLVADAGRARALLGWQPRHSDVECIIRDAWAWHRGWNGVAQQ